MRRLLSSGAAAIALAVVLTFPLLGARDLWAPDEPRYAEVAASMVRDGHWWMPHANGLPYAHKPHLFFWLAALASLPQGHVDELTARLPSALAGIVVAWLTLDVGRRLFGVAGGVASALVLATAWLPAWLSRRVALDVLLAVCTTAAAWALLRADEAARSGSRARCAGWGALAGACAAAGIMTKGPVALLPIAFAWGAVALARDGRPARRLPLALGLAVLSCAVVLLAWLGTTRALGGYDPIAIVREHVVERATEGRDHERPPWYYLATAPTQFLPWTFVAIPAAFAAWHALKRRDRHAWLLASWGFGPLVVLSIIVEKRELYVMPLVPAWALLVGAHVAAEEARGAVGRGSAIATRATVVLLAGLGVAGLVAAFVLDRPEADLPGVRVGAALVAVVALAAAALVATSLRRRADPLSLTWAVAVGQAAVLLAAWTLVLPRLDPVKSAREGGAWLARLPPDAPIAMMPRTWDAFAFYSGRRLADVATTEDARAWLASSSRPAYLLVEDRFLDDAPRDGASAPTIAFVDRVGHRNVSFLRYEHPS